MGALHVDRAVAAVVLDGAIEQFVETIETMTDFDLLAGSRCHGWSVLDVVVHVRAGLQEVLAAVMMTTRHPADQDVAGYWRDFADAEDQVASILWTRRTASAYHWPSAIVPHLQAAAEAVRSAIAGMRPGQVAFQGRVLSSGDFLATRCVELAVHQLDLSAVLEVPGPSAESLAIARASIDALLDAPFPDDWSETTCVLLGAGRRLPNDFELHRLGSSAHRLAVLG